MGRIENFCVALLVLGVAGCTTLPELPSRGQLKIDVIVDTIQCELKYTLEDLERRIDFLQNKFGLFAAKFSLTIEIDEDNSVGLTTSISRAIPINVFSLAVAPSITGRSGRDVQIDFSAITLNDLRRKQCDFAEVEDKIYVRRIIGNGQFYGNLGIYEWTRRSFEAFDKKSDYVTPPLTITHTAEFETKYGGQITPGINFLEIPGNAAVGGFVSGSRRDIDRLKISLTAP